MSNTELFKDNGYVKISNFLNKENCYELTEILQELVENKLTTSDDQCPLSQAIHGTVTFDKLLEDLLPHFEEHCGKKLYPTYSYARLYSPGEELKVHRDRAACEISATVTLGFIGKQWAIYMGDHEDKSDANEILMNVGDAVLYRGMDKWHWREKFEGEWQAQVFLHYVDADGEHADQKYDGRESLGLPKCFKETDIQFLPDYYGKRNGISKAFCSKLIEEYSKPETAKEPPNLGRSILEPTIDLNVRNVQRVLLPQDAGIGSTLTAYGLNTNYNIWKYDVNHSNQTEFLIYDSDGKYETHNDTFHTHSSPIRKLTVLAFLNDDFEGGKFYLQNEYQKMYPPQKAGTLIVFPSYMPHGVEPVTKGIRYSVVTWLLGPYFK
tara:strand:- start:233 stop:1372 length:1140 start_codon:yes stop_codon:yes gene_type:complete